MRSSIILLCFALCACSAQKKAVEKEQRYIQQLQNKYATFSEPSILTIPGGYIRLTDTVPCNDFTRKDMSSKSGILTITKPCPPVNFNLDSAIKNSKPFIHELLERKAAELNAQTFQEENNILRERIEVLTKQRNTCIKILVGIGVVLLAYIFGRIKKLLL
mgnify:CR=1 FL=1